MRQDQLIARLRQMCEHTTQASTAEQLKVSAQYLNDVLTGKRLPGPKILRAMGVTKKVVYTDVR